MILVDLKNNIIKQHRNNVTMKIDEKQEKWLNNSEIELSKNIKELSNNVSIKSNFIIAEFNFKLLKNFIIKLLKYVKYLRKTFNTENIMHDVLTEIQNKKLIIPIEYNIQIGEIKTKDIADYQYLVKRENDYTIVLKREKYENGNLVSDDIWKVGNLIVYVKKFDGTVVYPVIKTLQDSIEITFNDKLSTNYNVFIM